MIDRFKQIYSDLVETRVLSESRTKYIFLYVTSKILSLVRKILGEHKPKFVYKLVNKNDFVIKNSVGKFKVNLTTDSITKSSHRFEKKLQKWVLQTSNKGVFLDIGANIGFYTILALKHTPLTQAISFEPNPNVYKLLQKNIELNNIKAKPVNAAVSNTSNDLTLAQESFHTGASKIKSENSDDTVAVNSIILDEYIETTDIKAENIAFIKIDIEGHELNALKGMDKTLKNLEHSSLLFIEIWKNNKNQVRELLDQNGFVLLDNITNNYLFKKV